MAKIHYRKVPKAKRTGRRQKYELLQNYWKTIEIEPLVRNKPGSLALQGYITLYHDGLLAIYRHYRWDGASFFLARDTDKTIRATLVHDALYQLMREGLLDIKHRKAADKLMYDILVEDGIWRIEASIWYRAVRIFSAKYAKPKKLKG